MWVKSWILQALPFRFRFSSLIQSHLGKQPIRAISVTITIHSRSHIALVAEKPLQQPTSANNAGHTVKTRAIDAPWQPYLWDPGDILGIRVRRTEETRRNKTEKSDEANDKVYMLALKQQYVGICFLCDLAARTVSECNTTVNTDHRSVTTCKMQCKCQQQTKLFVTIEKKCWKLVCWNKCVWRCDPALSLKLHGRNKWQWRRVAEPETPSTLLSMILKPLFQDYKSWTFCFKHAQCVPPRLSMLASKDLPVKLGLMGTSCASSVIQKQIRWCC